MVAICTHEYATLWYIAVRLEGHNSVTMVYFQVNLKPGAIHLLAKGSTGVSVLYAAPVLNCMANSYLAVHKGAILQSLLSKCGSDRHI